MYIKTTDEIVLFAGSKYVTDTYIMTALEDIKIPPKIVTKPVPPLDEDGNDSTYVVDIQIFKEDIKAYSLLQRTFDSNMRQVYNVI